MIKRALIFVASMTVVAGIAWVGGYDFDRRGADAAAMLFSGLLLSFIASICPYKELFGDDYFGDD
jgi:hypothetical protein